MTGYRPSIWPGSLPLLVDEHLDLVRIRAAYTEGRGAPPCDPRLMVQHPVVRLHHRAALVAGDRTQMRR